MKLIDTKRDYATIAGIKFSIITTRSEIIFIDERYKTIIWHKNERNERLVAGLVLSVAANKSLMVA